MELRPEQLAELASDKALAPVYLVAGPERLRVLEAADGVRAAVAEWDGVIACDVGQRWDNRGLAGLDALFFIPLSYFCREFRTMKKLATEALVAAAA